MTKKMFDSHDKKKQTNKLDVARRVMVKDKGRQGSPVPSCSICVWSPLLYPRLSLFITSCSFCCSFCCSFSVSSSSHTDVRSSSSSSGLWTRAVLVSSCLLAEVFSHIAALEGPCLAAHTSLCVYTCVCVCLEVSNILYEALWIHLWSCCCCGTIVTAWSNLCLLPVPCYIYCLHSYSVLCECVSVCLCVCLDLESRVLRTWSLHLQVTNEPRQVCLPVFLNNKRWREFSRVRKQQQH